MKKIIIATVALWLICGSAQSQSCLDRDSGIWETGISCDCERPIAYPNPVNDEINFRFDDSFPGEVSIKIYDMMGRTIDKRKYALAPGIASFNVGFLAPGIYLYEIKNNTTIIIDRFQKE